MLIPNIIFVVCTILAVALLLLHYKRDYKRDRITGDLLSEKAIEKLEVDRKNGVLEREILDTCCLIESSLKKISEACPGFKNYGKSKGIICQISRMKVLIDDYSYGSAVALPNSDALKKYMDKFYATVYGGVLAEIYACTEDYLTGKKELRDGYSYIDFRVEIGKISGYISKLETLIPD